MTDKIFDANDRALEEHVMLGHPYTNHRQRILFWSTKLGCQWTGQVLDAPTILAFIEAGRWSARCECGNQEYVTPADPIFFCHACGNLQYGRAARPVIFPNESDRKSIEAALLERAVTPGLALTPIDRARTAKPGVPGLERAWQPGRKAKELRSEAVTVTASYQATQRTLQEKQP